MASFPEITREGMRATYLALLKEDALWGFLNLISPCPWDTRGFTTPQLVDAGRHRIMDYDARDTKGISIMDTVKKTPEIYGLLLSLLREGLTDGVKAAIFGFKDYLEIIQGPWYCVDNAESGCYDLFEERGDGRWPIGSIGWDVTTNTEDMTLILLLPTIFKIFKEIIVKEATVLDKWIETGSLIYFEPNYYVIKREILERILHPDLRIAPGYKQERER